MIDKKRSLWIYNKMNEIRNFELKALELFEENKLRGSVHLYIGEEAVAATICSSLRDEDYIASTHRGHGHWWAGCGLEKADGGAYGQGHRAIAKGRGGSMHIADLTKGNLGANGIVGGGSRLPRVRLSPSRCGGRTGSRWAFSATAPPTRAPSMSP